MNKKNVISLGVTLLCTVLILGMGYAGIVKGGKVLLSNEEAPKKAEFENTGSNIFYGKIEDDIQLYPWNYYGQNEIEESFLEVLGEPGNKNIDGLELTVRLLEAYCCNVDSEVIDDVYEKKQSKIVDNIKISSTDYGFIFFYQDILDVNGVRYQVKAAFDEWSILSFSCMEYRENDVRESTEWEKGKRLLYEMMDKYQWNIVEQLYDIRIATYLSMYESSYEDMLESVYGNFDQYVWKMEKLRDIQDAVLNGTEYKEEKIYGGIYDNLESSAKTDAIIEESNMGDYSCQIIELNDMILLLLQGDYTIGLLYDPVSQKFCGYNYFWQ